MEAGLDHVTPVVASGAAVAEFDVFVGAPAGRVPAAGVRTRGAQRGAVARMGA